MNTAKGRLGCRLVATAIALAASLMVLVGCFGNYLPLEPSPTDLRAKTLSSHPQRDYSDLGKWQQSPYFRIGDTVMEWPVFVLVADDGYGCVVKGLDWAGAQPHRRFHCSESWRSPR